MCSLPCDVHQATGHSLVRVEVQLKHSELLREECTRLILDSGKTVKRMKEDDSKRLDEHVRDIEFVKKELELKLEENVVETDVLLTAQSRVVKALEAYREALKVTVLCQEERMKRPPSERLRDEVDGELQKEEEVLEEVLSLLQRVTEQITEQIRLNRSAKFHLEQDLQEALTTTHSLTSLQRATAADVPSSSMTPKLGQNISDTSVVKAEQQRSSSASLRALVESALEQTAADLHKQVQLTADAFRRNVKKIKCVKSQMEDQLTKIQSEVSRQQDAEEELQTAIKQTEPLLTLMRSRMDLCAQRPPKERGHDGIESQQLAEIHKLTSHISRLRRAAAQSDAEQKALRRYQKLLQENILVQVSCLYVDEVACAQHRQGLVIHRY